MNKSSRKQQGLVIRKIAYVFSDGNGKTSVGKKVSSMDWSIQLLFKKKGVTSALMIKDAPKTERNLRKIA